MQKLLLSLLGIFLAYSTNAQSLSSISTESRCLNSGSITTTINGGTPSYSYSLTGGPSGASAPSYPTTISSSNTTETFNSLIPGTYFIEVLDQNGTYYDTVTVTGNYTEPRFDLNASDIICGGASDGMLWGTNIIDGREPYSFQIISPAGQVTGLQSSDTFLNLPAGTYQVRMFDSCGNFQTRTATIADTYTNVDIISSNSDGRVSCDSATLFVRPRYGREPYMVRVVDPLNSSNYIDSAVVLTESFTYTGFDLPIYYPGTSTTSTTNYRFEVTDACGNTDISFNRHNVFNSETTNGHCDGFSFSYGSSQFQNAVWGDSVWFEMSPDPEGLGRVGFANSGSRAITFDTLPFGNYTYTITTECDTLTGSFGEIDEPFDSIYVLEIPESCTEGMARIRVEPFGRPDGVYHTTIYKGSTFIDSVRHTETGRLFYGIDSGLYTITMWDDCEDTVIRTVLIDTGVTVSLTTETSPFCGGGGNIKAFASIVGTGTTFKYFRLFDSTGSEISGTRISTSADSAQWTNLAAGRYIVALNYNSINLPLCVPKTDTIELEGYQFPSIEALQVACTAGDYAVQGQNVQGVGPFTYYLRDQATLTVLRGPQTTDTFTNLTGAGPYNILVVDSCGNTANASVNPYTPNVNLSIINGQDCINQNLEAAIDTALQTIYSWTGPNGFTSSAKSISFNPVMAVDTGSYFLNANMLNGCLIIDDTFDLQANAITTANAPSPITATCFGSGPLYDSVVAVINGSNPASGENAYWQVLSTPANANYLMYDSTSNNLRMRIDSAGSYELLYTIVAPNGCRDSIPTVVNSVCGAIAVPVTLIDFYATNVAKGTNRIHWSTATEYNNAGFKLARSIDGIRFESIAYLEGAGHSNTIETYQYEDHYATLSSIIYYRLTQVDYDGTETNHGKVYLTLRSADGEITLVPNPAKTSVSIEGAETVEQIELRSLSGQLLYTANPENNQVNINLHQLKLEAGLYLIKTTTARGVHISRLVIE